MKQYKKVGSRDLTPDAGQEVGGRTKLPLIHDFIPLHNSRSAGPLPMCPAESFLREEQANDQRMGVPSEAEEFGHAFELLLLSWRQAPMHLNLSSQSQQ